MLRVCEAARMQIIADARACIGVSQYHGSAELSEAPHVVNCYRFTQWLWSLVGVTLPDHQLKWPQLSKISVDDVQIADLVFIPRLNYCATNDDFGHVGIATGDGSIIHATKWKKGVTEESAAQFLERGCLGIRRIPAYLYCRS